MGLVDFFLANRPTLAHMQLDCTVAEGHREGLRKSAYPVEDLADKTDHVEDLPSRVTIEGLVSDVAPIGFVGVDFVTGIHSLYRSKSAWALLKELKETHEPFIVQTSLAVYTRMTFADGESLSADRDVSNSNTLRFRAELERQSVAYTTAVEAVAAELADLAEDAAVTGMVLAGEASSVAAAAAAGAV